ncbi:L-threonylcarbamoyladenylate synthase [Natronorubrum daqingense]|uniref:L-threonylcarbamoyladenylate synthase n=1 Tax=Natronorubrum daqingense TaxID=588898 RepID=A0A1N7FAM5_9EURY|nr:L-threonylcarbamoyladenylate synthase [Natronorubrum daqingense]APX97656.1 threonylcarbamoyl-AMP synthase [Natronorubrum daqingense]SIR97428.1 L-threonylcarbamoyladenylate synthase [Natronorubrum daqingense]
MDTVDAETLERGAAAIRAGELVVYPTETVYGLGANALDADAVERVFEVKARARSKPVSFAVPSFETAVEAEYIHANERERAFAAEFLPGPVTVLCERGEAIPDVLTAGADRVGVRVPDCEPALELLERAARPITATSANVSGEPSARRVADIGSQVRNAALVLEADDLYASGRETDEANNGDEANGANDANERTESTVVDVSTGTIHRRGANATAIDAWLEEN